VDVSGGRNAATSRLNITDDDNYGRQRIESCNDGRSGAVSALWGSSVCSNEAKSNHGSFVLQILPMTSKKKKAIQINRRRANCRVVKKRVPSKEKNSALNKIAWHYKIRYEDYNVLRANSALFYKIAFDKKVKNKKI
jgi:hypothetical protein